jgi:hypothetical protein
MLRKTFLPVVLSVVLFLGVCASATADVPPPVYGIDIVSYEYSIEQEAGTLVYYEVEVENTGVLALRDIVLESEKLPEGWFLSIGSVDLEFEKTGTVGYEIALPKNASGLHAFSLIARGSYGVGEATKIVPIVLNIVKAKSVEETTTTTTEPPAITIPDLETSDAISLLNPERIFSKFREAVGYVRVRARAVLTDEVLLYNTVIALIIVVVALLVVKRIAFRH